MRVPAFEFVGPPCEHPGCKGVLLDNINHKEGVFYRKCTECGRKFHEVPVEEKMRWSLRVLHRVLKGTKED